MSLNLILQKIKYGVCNIIIPMKTIPELLVKEVLNPFYLFQVIAHALIIIDLLILLVVLGSLLLLRVMPSLPISHCLGSRHVRHYIKSEKNSRTGALCVLG